MATTLAQLRQRFYERFDSASGQGAHNYITDGEANRLLNEGAEHLHNWIVTEGEYYLWKEVNLPLVAGQADYPVPNDFLKILKVFCQGHGSSTFAPAQYPLERIMPEEFHGGSPQTPSGFGQSPRGYMQMGQVLRLLPTPGLNSPPVLLWYAPSFTPLVADTDTLSTAVIAGAEEFIINQAVIAARIKEESDTTALERRQGQILQMMQTTISNRDWGKPQHVVDVNPWG
jgi:hypothetical protein